MDHREEIEKVAYELWEKSGRPEGRDLENWCKAERIVLAAKEGKSVEGPSGKRPEADTGRGRRRR